MALDRQRILGELGSVMHQLQSADCGCLGKLFGNSQQAAQPAVGSPLPTCGGCRRGCCHGHGCGQYSSPTPINQGTTNLNYMSMPMDTQQPLSGNMHGYGPQIVNMMKGDHIKSQNASGHAQGQMPGVNGSVVIDAPQAPHGKVGLTPFIPPSMAQQGYLNPNMNQGDVTGLTQNQFIPQVNTNTRNAANVCPWSQQNINSTAPQMANPQANPWQQQSIATNPAAHQTPTPHNNPHGQHSEGIAKFNKMFPGVKQGLGGNLGFDPMAIAVQMNPDNHLQSAVNTMNNIMNGNKGVDQMFTNPPVSQTGVVNPNSPVQNETMLRNPVPYHVAQGNSQMANQQAIAQNIVPNQESPIQPHTYSNVNGQPIPPQNQQLYAAAINQNAVSQQMRYEGDQQLADHQAFEHQEINSTAPNLPLIQNEVTEEVNQLQVEDPGYPNQAPMQRMIKEPIFPVDTSKNQMYMPTKQDKNRNYGYNTLGQPVEMLPAKMYHPPEPCLPQTLSPQPNPVKPRSYPVRAANVKATISKTSLMGNKQIGKTPSRAQLQHIYNQYKGSQSFTQQNVRHPGEGTCSDGRLNVPQAMKAPPVPVERVGGDSAVNNPITNQERKNMVEQVMGQVGDVPAAKPGGDSLPSKEAPIRKCRNGLQDMVFSSYPTSAAWTFHGHGRNDNSPSQRYRLRRY